MSTTEVTTWAVDLATVGPIYPFVGTEMMWFILGLLFWVGFHVWQIGFERDGYDKDLSALSKPEDVQRIMKTGQWE